MILNEQEGPAIHIEMPEEDPQTLRPSPVAGLGAFLVALFGLLLFSVILQVLRLAGSGVLNLVTIVYQGAIYTIPLVLYYRKHEELRPSLRLRGFDPLAAVLVALAAAFGVFALNGITVYWMLLLDTIGLTTSSGNDMAPRTAQQLGWMILTIAVTPALFEELLFRGFLMPSIEPSGRGRAVVISGVLFALLHGTPEALPAHLLLGCVLAILVLSTGSLFAGMLYHFVYNGLILLISYAVMTVPRAASETAAATPTGSLPLVLAMVGVWLLFTYLAMKRGAQRRKDPLPDAAPKRWDFGAKLLFGISIAMLLIMQLSSIWAMLPGTGG